MEIYFPKESFKPNFCLPFQEEQWSPPRILQAPPTQCKPTQDPSGPTYTMQTHAGSLRPHPHISKRAPLSPCNNLQRASLHCNVFVVSKCPSITCVKWDLGDYLPFSFKFLSSVKYITNDSYGYPDTYTQVLRHVYRWEDESTGI